jgi:integrase
MSRRRFGGWSTWNTICTFLFTNEEIGFNPMPLIGRPKIAKTLPKAIDGDAAAQLLAAIAADAESRRRNDWAERDRAIVLTALLAGLRADELVRSNIGDVRVTDDGGVINVRGKGGKDRRIPVEQGLIRVLDVYLESRARRFPGTAKRRSGIGGLAAWSTNARSSSGAMASASPAGHYSHGSYVHSNGLGLTANAPAAVSSTGYGTPMRPNSRTPKSACTRS